MTTAIDSRDINRMRKRTKPLTNPERYAPLVRLIDEYQEGRADSLSDRALSIAVTGKSDFVRYLRDGRGKPSATELVRLAEACGLPSRHFINGQVEATEAERPTGRDHMADSRLDLFKLAYRATERLMRDYGGPNPDDLRAELHSRIYIALQHQQEQGKTIDEDFAISLVDAVFIALFAQRPQE